MKKAKAASKKITMERVQPQAALKRKDLSDFSKDHKDARIRQCFENVSMINRSQGLSAIAKAESGIDASDLKMGDFLLFFNTEKSKLAILGANGFVGYIGHPQGHRMDMRMVQGLGRYFRGEEFRYDKILQPYLEKLLTPKARTKAKEDTDGVGLH